MDKADICFVSYGLYSYLNQGSSENAGGAERQQYLIAKELVDRGYNVSAIVGDYGQEKHETIEGIEVWRAYRSVGKSGFKSSRGLIKLPLQIGKIMKTIGIVDSENYYTRSSLYYTILYLCSKIKNIQYYCGLSHDRDVEASSIDSNNIIFRKLYLMALRNSEQVISQTEYQKRTLYNNYEVESIVINNGYIIPKEIKRNPTYFLWVGRAEKESKNPEIFLDLARQLRQFKFMLIIAPGQNEVYYQELRNQAQKLANVVFEGFVAPNDIQSYYRNAIALVNTSSGEGFPNTFLEAWSVGTPVISLNVDLDGLLEQKKIGKYSGSFEQLVNDARELAENDELNSRMGKRGREYTISNHSIEEITDEFERVIL